MCLCGPAASSSLTDTRGPTQAGAHSAALPWLAAAPGRLDTGLRGHRPEAEPGFFQDLGPSKSPWPSPTKQPPPRCGRKGPGAGAR